MHEPSHIRPNFEPRNIVMNDPLRDSYAIDLYTLVKSECILISEKLWMIAPQALLLDMFYHRHTAPFSGFDMLDIHMRLDQCSINVSYAASGCSGALAKRSERRMNSVDNIRYEQGVECVTCDLKTPVF